MIVPPRIPAANTAECQISSAVDTSDAIEQIPYPLGFLFQRCFSCPAPAVDRGSLAK